MSPQIRSLLAKEWAERRSTLALGIVVGFLFLGYCIAYEIEYRTRAMIANYYSSCGVFSLMASVLLAMPTAAGEYSRRTIKFSASLPVSLRQVAWVRLLGAWTCLAVPILIGACIITALVASGLIEQAGLRETSTESLSARASMSRGAAIALLWTTIAIALAGAVQLMTLISFIGTRCRTEGQVGFWGAVICLIWGIFLPIHWIWLAALSPQSLADCPGFGELDGAIFIDLRLAPMIWGPLAASLVVTWLLGCWFARSYGHRQETASAKPAKRRWWRPTIPFSTIPRLPGRLGSLIWLDLRQSIPLSLAGLTLAVLITMLQISGDHDTPGPLYSRVAGELPHTTFFVATFWSAIVGVGIFATELEPGLQHFWRTRPISPAMWFWTKFIVGLTAVLTVLDFIPATLGWKSPHQTMGPTGFAYLACMPLFHAENYAMAVAAICWLRRPVASAVAALIGGFAIEVIMTSIPGQTDLGISSVYNNLDHDERLSGSIDLMSHNYPLVFGVILAAMCAATVLAHVGALRSRHGMDS